MSNEEKKQQILELLKDVSYLTVHDVMDVNHKPHPYTIGSKHIGASSGMYLDIEECERKGVTCAHPGCQLSYKDHTSDNVCFLTLTKDVDSHTINQGMKDLVDRMDKDLVDGFCFVESKFEILND